MRRYSHLARSTGSSLGLTFISNLLFYAGQLAILHTLSRESYSQFTLVLSSVVLVSLFVDLGLAPLLTQLFAEGEVRRREDDGTELKTAFWTALILKSVMGAVILTIIAFTLFTSHFTSDVRLMGIGFTIAFLFSSRILVLRSVGESLLKALDRYNVVVLANTLDAVALATCFLFLSTQSFSGGTAALIYGIANLPGFFYLTIVVVRWYRSNLTEAPGSFSYSMLKRIAKSGFPLTLATGFMLIHNEGDKLLVGLLSTADEVARFRASFAILGALLFLPTVISSIYTPRAARALTQGNASDANKSAVTGFHLLVILSGASAVALAAAPTQVASLLLGAKYSDVGSLVFIIACETVFISAAAYLLDLSVMAKRTWIVARYMGSVAICSALLDLILIPILGAEGAMIGKGAGVLAGIFVLLREVSGSALFQLTSLKEISKVALAAALGVGVGLTLPIGVPLLGSVVGVLVYFALIALFRALPKADIRVYLGLRGNG